MESLSKDTSLPDRTVSGYPEKNWTNQSNIKSIRGHPLISTYAQFSEKLTFLTPLYAHIRVRIKGLEILVLQNVLRTYLMSDP